MDNQSNLAEAIGLPTPGGGFTWTAGPLGMKDGTTLKVLKKSTITATCIDGVFRVFFVAAGGDIMQAYRDKTSGWGSVVVSGGY